MTRGMGRSYVTVGRDSQPCNLTKPRPLSFRTVRRRAERAEGERGICCAAREAILRLYSGQQEPCPIYRRHRLSHGASVAAKSGECDGFTQRYKVNRLVYYEVFQYVNNAIARETEVKKWRREKKVALFEADNPTWEDLAADWGKSVAMTRADSSPAGASSE